MKESRQKKQKKGFVKSNKNLFPTTFHTVREFVCSRKSGRKRQLEGTTQSWLLWPTPMSEVAKNFSKPYTKLMRFSAVRKPEKYMFDELMKIPKLSYRKRKTEVIDRVWANLTWWKSCRWDLPALVECRKCEPLQRQVNCLVSSFTFKTK